MSTLSRRDLLRHSTTATLTGAAIASALTAPGAYAAEDNTINIALVGCGGRGTGACGQALSTTGPTKLVAMADVFEHRLENSRKGLAEKFGANVDVPKDRQFLGFDAFKKAVDALKPGRDVVLLTTPPGFRHVHFEYAVSKGLNVFMEKSFGTDSPAARRIIAAGKIADQKNLKVAGGLMWRHCSGRQALVDKVRDGALGELVMIQADRMHGAIGMRPRTPEVNELGHQIRNYNSFTWCNGGFMLDWLIHDIDVCCWVKGALPVSAQGHGGRAQREVLDQNFDHFCVEYTFPDGTRLFAQGRHMDNVHNVYSCFFFGTKGSAALWEAVRPQKPEIFNGWQMTRGKAAWTYDGPLPNPYQVEHDRLFDAIRNNKPYNESERCAKACLVSIMGRMAAESGKLVTWDDTLKSEFQLAPGIENWTWDSKPPIEPDKDGRYAIAVPGKSKVM